MIFTSPLSITDQTTPKIPAIHSPNTVQLQTQFNSNNPNSQKSNKIPIQLLSLPFILFILVGGSASIQMHKVKFKYSSYTALYSVLQGKYR